jgi:hypothetical protein
MTIARALCLLATLSCAGCANPGRTYADKHPETSAVHRQILVTGTIPDGNAIAGMSQEEVKIAMHGFPTSYDKINGEDAWVYVAKKSVPTTDRDDATTTSSNGKPERFSASDNGNPESTVNIKTTIYFQGGRATHADTHDEKP